MKIMSMVGGITPKYYTNPYLIGLLLGFVLLSAFVIMGRGLGASSPIKLLSVAVDKFMLFRQMQRQIMHFMKDILEMEQKIHLKDWLVFAVIGVVTGGFISGAISGRNKIMVEKGPRISNKGTDFFCIYWWLTNGIWCKIGTRLYKWSST